MAGKSKIRKLFQILKWVFLLIILFSVITLLYMIGQDFIQKNETLLKSFNKDGVALRVHHVPYQNDSVRYIETGLSNLSSPLLLFVHGAPGGCDAFNKFLKDAEFLRKYQMVSIDRLGYGYSHYGKAEVSIKKQAEMLGFIVDQYKSDQVILIGHSFGGPIVMSGALEKPGKVKAVILLSPALDPELEKIFWFSSIPLKFGFRKLFSESFKVSSYEKLAHKEALLEVVRSWDQISQPILHIHGGKDQLVNPLNINFTKNLATKNKKEIIFLKGAGHLIPWTRTRELKDSIEKFIQKLEINRDNSQH